MRGLLRPDIVYEPCTLVVPAVGHGFSLTT